VVVVDKVEEVEETSEESVLEIDVVIVDQIVEVVLKDEIVEIVLEEGLVEVMLMSEDADIVDEELTARLLYIFNAFEPPQYSSGFPLQVNVQAVESTTLPALGELPQ
jgi:hypothetical protein